VNWALPSPTTSGKKILARWVWQNRSRSRVSQTPASLQDGRRTHVALRERVETSSEKPMPVVGTGRVLQAHGQSTNIGSVPRGTGRPSCSRGTATTTSEGETRYSDPHSSVGLAADYLTEPVPSAASLLKAHGQWMKTLRRLIIAPLPPTSHHGRVDEALSQHAGDVVRKRRTYNQGQ